MLVAGAGAGNTLAHGGALTFHVTDLPSNSYWPHGSALFLLAFHLYII